VPQFFLYLSVRKNSRSTQLHKPLAIPMDQDSVTQASVISSAPIHTHLSRLLGQ